MKQDNERRWVPLTKFEEMAQRLVEDSFKRLFGSRMESLDVAARLAKTMEDSHAAGKTIESFAVYLNPTDYDSLIKDNPALAPELANYVSRLALEGGYPAMLEPRVKLISDAAIGRHLVQVKVSHREEMPDQTTQMRRPLGQGDDPLAPLQQVDAYLIIEGRQHIPLDKAVTTIGRRTENDIVLDSMAISRQHAQIRWRLGRFVIYDLGGRQRTKVNDKTVSECVLKPGDVITLSDVALIYGEGREDRPSPPAASDSQISETMIMPGPK